MIGFIGMPGHIELLLILMFVVAPLAIVLLVLRVTEGNTPKKLKRQKQQRALKEMRERRLGGHAAEIQTQASGQSKNELESNEIGQSHPWSFWSWWGACTLGWALGMFCGVFVAELLPESLGLLVILTMGGTLAGILQWRLLKQHVDNAGWWVWTSALGWGLGGIVALFAVEGPAALVFFIVWLGMPGLLQWLVLRGQVARAGWWVVVSTLGWIVGFIGAAMVVGAGESKILVAVLGAVTGAIYGAITGFALGSLLRHTRQKGGADPMTLLKWRRKELQEYLPCPITAKPSWFFQFYALLVLCT